MKPHLIIIIMMFIFLCCTTDKKNDEQLKKELASIELKRGEITLCSSGTDQFGSVSFTQSCSEKTRTDFNLAIALLHSFEYTEAEKVFVKVIDQDPQCVMAYWGAAMSNFHPLWSPPSPTDLEKGSKIIMLARKVITDKSSRESAYIEAIATIYDQWNTLDHRTRLLKFEKASQALYENYTDDDEAAIFYALALGAAADPADKTFQKQKKAGDVLKRIYEAKPNHPGIAHYIIHNYDYPELATLGLPAARKYASIAPASAHAQHMPSHIFTRLGLWDESIQSNIASVTAAQCYAEKSGIKGHWDEELHGLDYLVYAYLQKADDEKALRQVQYLQTIKEVFPVNFKDAYSFASMPARYVLERKDWAAAATLQPQPADFPWEKFPWEKANIYFARLLGAVHTNKLSDARKELEQLKALHTKLTEAKENYKSNLVLIQVKASEAWIKLAEGQKDKALVLMTEAADMEDATAKHPVTPGEIIPARELLADMYLQTGNPQRALQVYEDDLKRHPNRFNGIYGAAIASEKAGNAVKAKEFYGQLMVLAEPGSSRLRLMAEGSKE